MPKKLIQDIIPNNKKGGIKLIRKDDIKIKRPEKEVQIPIHTPVSEPTTPKFVPEKKVFFDDDFQQEEVSKNSHVFLWIISIAATATLLFVFSLIFATATVTITPKKEPVILNDIYTIVSASSTPGLHYQVLSLQKTLSESLTTDGEQDVQHQAIGKAIIYNNFSAATQRLINNTRLQTTDGAIYRIRASVDVPGVKTVNGVKTPGSVEVEIISDLPGDKYNMKVSDLKGDFTIPGFQGTSKYAAFYARLSSDAVGGYTGTAKTVAANVLAAGRQDAINTLTADLIKDMYATTTNQNTILKNNYFVQTTDLPDTADASGYTINEQVNLYAIVFNTNELSTFIAKDKLADFDNSKVDVLWNNDVTATPSGITATPWTEPTLKMQISGDANVVWTYDATAILKEIAGQSKSILQDVLNQNKNSITEIQANIRPEWKTTFPDNTEKIEIIDSVRDSSSK